jgi:hypothetical protein
MKRYQFINVAKVLIGLALLFLILYIYFQGVSRNPSLESSTIKTREDSFVVYEGGQFRDCPDFDPHITPRHLFQAYFATLNNSVWQPNQRCIRYHSKNSIFYFLVPQYQIYTKRGRIIMEKSWTRHILIRLSHNHY